MKIAAIDMGTNTTLLLVAEYTASGEIIPLQQAITTTRLGETNPQQPHLITPRAMQATLITLKNYLEICAQHRVKQVLIAATAPLRSKTNGAELVERIHRETGCSVQILSPPAEAELSYLGAISNKSHLPGLILVLDIGGGSSEIIMGEGKQIKQSVSLPIGAVNLTEKFIQSDPPLETELNQLRTTIQNTLKELIPANFRFDQVIGTAGTITSLAAIKSGLRQYQPELIDGQMLTRSAIETLFAEFCLKTLSQRQQIIGLEPERADIIIAGTALLLEILDWFKINRFIVSERCLRYGMIVKANT